MFRPLSGFIGWRFSRAKYGQGFISFISASSTIGIALGCLVLILVLSVMNGFERELKDRLLSLVPHAELISANEQMIQQWPQLAEALEQNPYIDAVAPVIRVNGMLLKKKSLKALQIRGIDPAMEPKVSDVANYVDTKQWQSLEQNENNIVLGQGVLETLDLSIGDKVKVLIPKINSQMGLKATKTVTFTITGTFSIGGQLDYGLAYISLKRAQSILSIEGGVQGLRLKVNDVFKAPMVAREAGQHLPYYLYLHDWTRTHGHLYQDIQLVRTIMYLVMAIVIAVACFNIVSTLVMAVNEKRSDIAILKTMGASRGLIVRSFMIHGLTNGLFGTIIGGSLGVIASINVGSWFGAIQSLMGTQILQKDVYFIDFLPSQLMMSDVVITCLMAFGLSVIATLYPAKKAAQIEPAVVLGGV